jgi:hypothetical protein
MSAAAADGISNSFLLTYVFWSFRPVPQQFHAGINGGLTDRFPTRPFRGTVADWSRRSMTWFEGVATSAGGIEPDERQYRGLVLRETLRRSDQTQ